MTPATNCCRYTVYSTLFNFQLEKQLRKACVMRLAAIGRYVSGSVVRCFWCCSSHGRLSADPRRSADLRPVWRRVWPSWEQATTVIRCQRALVTEVTWSTPLFPCIRIFLVSPVRMQFYRRPYNLYCVGGDVKPCSINQSTACSSLRILVQFAEASCLSCYWFVTQVSAPSREAPKQVGARPTCGPRHSRINTDDWLSLKWSFSAAKMY